MRKLLVSLLIIWFVITLWARPSATVAAPSASPAEVIAAINQYRAQNGLYAYQTNSILMSTAQEQSNYQASIGAVTHTGAGGTRPIDRAYNGGYGDGQLVFVSEIIYGGTNASVNDAVTWWKNSPVHNEQMLATTYIEIGAGVATDGIWTYYTAVMGYVAGGDAPPGAGGGNKSGSVYIPVAVSTPNADGSIVHIVQSGQILIDIAEAYSVVLSEILALNNLLVTSFIFPGDEILIRLATLQEPATQTPTQADPTTTNMPQPTQTAAASPTASTLAASAGSSDLQSGGNPPAGQGPDTAIRWLVILVVAGGFFMLMGGLLIPKSKEVNLE